MNEQKLSTADLARFIGRSAGTVQNVCYPSAPSKAARQLITNFFNVPDIWPGIRPQLGDDVLEIITDESPRKLAAASKGTNHI
jgi:hypothetical protein